jgi:hypothetical protein
MSYQEAAAGEELVFKFPVAGLVAPFSAACSINTDRQFEFTADIYQGWRSDCDNPSDPSRPVRRVKGVDVKFTGQGTGDMPSVQRLMQLVGSVFEGQLSQDVTHGFDITGSWVIESLSLGGNKGEDQAFSISIGVAAPDFLVAYR